VVPSAYAGPGTMTRIIMPTGIALRFRLEMRIVAEVGIDYPLRIA
jgi:hypothetical protein